ncbi:hypothetical protein EMPS_11316 [Entomortierella parvispora]|uniref:FAD-binding domain-containing protein n=1 Tax=Entomortierella parvispora TaxID=205924 RepID=A0A9P3HLM2_9FUNG|nr:hypothetical protein EMPS_11316 [Entomortierella parvispora]
MAPPQFKVIIAGGGIAGLSLGVMLERAGIDYVILEATHQIQALGGIVYLGPPLMRVMEQLGLLEDLLRNSNYLTGITMLDHELRRMCRFNTDHAKERYGYSALTIVRPKLYDILLSRIPAYKILFGKRVISSDLSAAVLNNDSLLELSYKNSDTESDQNNRSILVRCEDGSSYAGDILVGADGGSSPIRESMYRDIQKAAAAAKAASVSGRSSSAVKETTLHPSDYAHSRVDQQCISGITEPMAATAYPVLRSKNCELMLVLPKDANCAIWFVPMIENRFGWGVTTSIVRSRSRSTRPPAEGAGESTGRASLESRFEGSGVGSGGNSGSRAFREHYSSVAPIEATLMSSSSLSMPSSSSGKGRTSRENMKEQFKNAPGGASSSTGPTLQRTIATGSQSTLKSSDRESIRLPGGVVPAGGLKAPKHATLLQPVESVIHQLAALDMDEQKHQLEQLQEMALDRTWSTLDQSLTIEESIQDQASPFGGTLRDLVDATSKKMISVVVVEEKCYRTWYHGRTLLIGDACHKLQTSSNHGPTQAILDSISLANLLSKLQTNRSGAIKELFHTHFQQRNPNVKDAIWASSKQDQLLFNRKVTGRMIRKLSSSNFAEKIMIRMLDRTFASRPTLDFLQPVPERLTSLDGRSSFSSFSVNGASVHGGKKPFGFLGKKKRGTGPYHRRTGSEPSASTPGGSLHGGYFESDNENEEGETSELDLATAFSMSSFAMPPPPPIFPTFAPKASQYTVGGSGRALGSIQELGRNAQQTVVETSMTAGAGSGTRGSNEAMAIEEDDDLSYEFNRKKSPWRLFKGRSNNGHTQVVA